MGDRGSSQYLNVQVLAFFFSKCFSVRIQQLKELADAPFRPFSPLVLITSVECRVST